jgi:peptidoglycan/LPS O-acetylase OafA/YrhL
MSSPALAHAPENQPRAKPSFYRPELDVLRFFAFFSVFVCHLAPVPIPASAPATKVKLLYTYALIRESGAFGMCIFFLLSAYLITELLIRERISTGSIHLGAFYIRRILRIWPLYFGAVFAGYFVGLLLSQFHLRPMWVAAFLLLAGNWYTVRNGYGPSIVDPCGASRLKSSFISCGPASQNSAGFVLSLFARS